MSLPQLLRPAQSLDGDSTSTLSIQRDWSRRRRQVTRGNSYLIDGIAVVAFISVAVVLGAAVLFAAVAFLIGPHGGGILPEWSNPLVLVLLAGGVGYVSYKAAIWTKTTLTRRMGAN